MKFVQLLNKNLGLTSVTVGLIFFLIASVSLERSPLITRGEGREAQVVQAMERTGNLILPLRNDSVVPSKPPLFHWMAFGFSKLSGVNELSLRLPSSFAAALLLSTSLFYFSKLFSPIIGLLSAAIAFSCLEFLRYSTQARVDMVFSSAFSLGLFCLYSFIKGEKQICFFFLSTLFLTLSVLSKGPFGIILPGAVVGLFILLTQRLNNFRLIIKLSLIFLLATAISAVWYYLAYSELGERFLAKQLFKENIARVIDSDMEGIGHRKPAYYVILYFLQILIPWSIFLPRAVYGFSFAKFKELFNANEFSLYCVIWLLIMSFAIMFNGSMRSVYFLPAIAPIGLIFALLISFSREVQLPYWIESLEKLILNILLVVAFSLILFSFLLNCFISVDQQFLSILSFKNEVVLEVVKIFSTLEGAVFSLFALFVLLNLKKEYLSGRFENFVIHFSAAIFIVFAAVQIYFAPIFLSLDDPRQFVRQVKEVLPQDAALYQLNDEYYAPVYYLNRSATLISGDDLRTKKGTFFVLLKTKYLFELSELGFHYQILVSGRNKKDSKGSHLYLVKVTS